MLRHIPVPLDGSAFAESALPLALEVARRADGGTRLINVQELDPQVAGPSKSLGDQGHGAVTTHVATGHAPECIEEEAGGWEADLVVMASHGRGGASRAWLGARRRKVGRGMSLPGSSVGS